MSQRRFINLLLIFFGLLLAIKALGSLKWSCLHDSAVLLYTGLLVGRFGMVPYRDFFDMNMPGAHLFNAAVGRIFGYGDLGYRCADLAWLALVLALTWSWMRTLDRRAAWAGTLLFGLAYLGYGEVMSLQREFIALAPIAAALAVALAPGGRLKPGVRAGLSGLCWGLAATIKPQLAIGLAPTVAYLISVKTSITSTITRNNYEHEGRTQAKASSKGLVAWAILGAALPGAVLLGWLGACGALGAFADLVLHYWPLYGALTGGHYPIHGLDRLAYMGEEFQKFGSLGPWLVPATVGLMLTLMDQGRTADYDTEHELKPGQQTESRAGMPVPQIHEDLLKSEQQTTHNKQRTTNDKHNAALLAALVGAYALYPALSGQFWSYHWLPLHYFLIQAGALCVAGPVAGDSDAPGRIRRFVPGAFCLFALALVAMMPGMQPWSNYKWLPPDTPARAEAIGKFLKTRLRPGERVQVLDWTAGGIHGALLAQAPPATRFIYDFHFYHDVSTPYIQGLRKEFLDGLRRTGPRFIVRTNGPDRPYVRGRDTSTEFEGLEALLRTDYRPAAQGPGFVIYERAAR